MALTFTAHTASQRSSFRLAEIHDYKSTSSTSNSSSTLPNHLSSPHTVDPSPSSPVDSLGIPYCLFLKAVQERLINDICSAQDHDRRLCRLNGGFLIFPQHPTSDWGTGWEHRAQNRFASCCVEFDFGSLIYLQALNTHLYSRYANPQAYPHPTPSTSNALCSHLPITASHFRNAHNLTSIWNSGILPYVI
jgi:Mediator complex subunit 13 N-terminal